LRGGRAGRDAPRRARRSTSRRRPPPWCGTAVASTAPVSLASCQSRSSRSSHWSPTASCAIGMSPGARCRTADAARRRSTRRSAASASSGATCTANTEPRSNAMKRCARAGAAAPGPAGHRQPPDRRSPDLERDAGEVHGATSRGTWTQFGGRRSLTHDGSLRCRCTPTAYASASHPRSSSSMSDGSASRSRCT
jgi:hypothetical protein